MVGRVCGCVCCGSFVLGWFCFGLLRGFGGLVCWVVLLGGFAGLLCCVYIDFGCTRLLVGPGVLPVHLLLDIVKALLHFFHYAKAAVDCIHGGRVGRWAVHCDPSHAPPLLGMSSGSVLSPRPSGRGRHVLALVIGVRTRGLYPRRMQSTGPWRIFVYLLFRLSLLFGPLGLVFIKSLCWPRPRPERATSPPPLQ